MNIANHSLDDLKNLFFFGEKVETPYFTFYPPTIKDVLDSGQSEFAKYVTTLIGKKDKISFSCVFLISPSTIYQSVENNIIASIIFLRPQDFFLYS